MQAEGTKTVPEELVEAAALGVRRWYPLQTVESSREMARAVLSAVSAQPERLQRERDDWGEALRQIREVMNDASCDESVKLLRIAALLQDVSYRP